MVCLESYFSMFKADYQAFWKLGPCFGMFLDKSSYNAYLCMQRLRVQPKPLLLAAILSFLGHSRCLQCKHINVHKVEHCVENTRTFKGMASVVYLQVRKQLGLQL